MFLYLVTVHANYHQGILFNPYGVVTLLRIFTTGFGLRPAPAAIIVMTPPGSDKKKTRVNGGHSPPYLRPPLNSRGY